MDSLSLIRPVLVKVQVTESYKKNASVDLLEAVRQIELKLQHLDYQEKRLLSETTKSDAAGVPAAKQQIGQERRQYEENKRELLRRFQEVQGLALGAEVVYGKMESATEIKVGDMWRPVLGTEIILRDGVITEIRRPETEGGDSLP